MDVRLREHLNSFQAELHEKKVYTHPIKVWALGGVFLKSP